MSLSLCPRSPRWGVTTMCRTLASAALASAALASAALVSTAPSASASIDDPEVFLSFEGSTLGGSVDLTSTGTAEVRSTVTSALSGSLTAVPGRLDGKAVRTERYDADAVAHPAVIVVRPAAGAADVTDPGARSFSFGADFSLDAASDGSSTDNGDNLIQRGLHGETNQYKIQLDGGVPSCRVSGSQGSVSVRAAQRVVAGEWYRVRCRRTGDGLTLRLVDYGDYGRQSGVWSASGSIGSVWFPDASSPMSVGGKVDEDGRVLVTSSDEFNGRIDNVVYRTLG